MVREHLCLGVLYDLTVDHAIRDHRTRLNNLHDAEIHILEVRLARYPLHELDEVVILTLPQVMHCPEKLMRATNLPIPLPTEVLDPLQKIKSIGVGCLRGIVEEAPIARDHLNLKM
jgi:hypothetical protein